MSQSLSEPAESERIVQQELHERIKDEIRRRGMTFEQLASELNILPVGARALMERSLWPIETALRIAQLLKINMRLEIK